MICSTYNFYFSTSTTQVLGYTVPWDCELVAVDFSAGFVSSTDAATGMIYLLLPGAGSSTVSGADGIVAAIRTANSLTGAAGMVQSFVNKYCLLPRIRLSRNTALNGVATINGTMTMVGNAILFFNH